jgi:tetratricopeptide (TPR) repeat protein
MLLQQAATFLADLADHMPEDSEQEESPPGAAQMRHAFTATSFFAGNLKHVVETLEHFKPSEHTQDENLLTVAMWCVLLAVHSTDNEHAQFVALINSTLNLNDRMKIETWLNTIGYLHTEKPMTFHTQHHSIDLNRGFTRRARGLLHDPFKRAMKLHRRFIEDENHALARTLHGFLNGWYAIDISNDRVATMLAKPMSLRTHFEQKFGCVRPNLRDLLEDYEGIPDPMCNQVFAVARVYTYLIRKKHTEALALAEKAFATWPKIHSVIVALLHSRTEMAQFDHSHSDELELRRSIYQALSIQEQHPMANKSYSEALRIRTGYLLAHWLPANVPQKLPIAPANLQQYFSARFGFSQREMTNLGNGRTQVKIHRSCSLSVQGQLKPRPVSNAANAPYWKEDISRQASSPHTRDEALQKLEEACNQDDTPKWVFSMLIETLLGVNRVRDAIVVLDRHESAMHPQTVDGYRNGIERRVAIRRVGPRRRTAIPLADLTTRRPVDRNAANEISGH